jgi:hypothetical protein
LTYIVLHAYLKLGSLETVRSEKSSSSGVCDLVLVEVPTPSESLPSQSESSVAFSAAGLLAVLSALDEVIEAGGGGPMACGIKAILSLLDG